jgi:pimeloyl-ACP methyl ester carboxylesterase
MKPTLLLLAGMLNDERLWQPVAQRLSAVCDVRIAHFPTQESIAEMAQTAWQLVADLPPDRPLALAGFSMGGYVLQEMLAEPQRGVQAVALIDSSIRPETEASRANRLKTLQAIAGNFPALVEQVARWSTHPSRHGDEALMGFIKTMLLEVGPQTAASQTRAIAARGDHAALMRQLQVPTLIACGRQDKVTPPDLSQEAADQMPQAQLHWLDDTGHMSPLEQAARLAELITQWLARLASTDPSKGHST